VVFINTRFVIWMHRRHLRALSTNATSKLNILGHNGDTLGVNGAKIGVLEESNEVSLSSFLKGKNGRPLEAEISLEILSNLTNKSLERKLADEELSGLLVSADLSKCNSPWAVSVRLLHSTSGRSGLAGSLCGELLSWGLASS
jgi:hypothetical protein